MERKIKGKKEKKFYRYHRESIKILEASALQGVENYDPSSWLPAEALYLQLRSQTSSDLHLQLNEDVSINSLKLLRFVQRQPSGLPGGLVAYFIQGFFFFFECR